MIERVTCTVIEGRAELRSACMRYSLLERVAASVRRGEVALLAFGLNDRELRLVLRGDETAIGHVVRGIKVGTTRAVREHRVPFAWGATQRAIADDLEQAVAWAHRAPVEGGVTGPLASPWSSHRDLMGVRSAMAWDLTAVDGLVDPQRVHQLAGGTVLIDDKRVSRRPDSLGTLLRVTAAVLGVLPADRRCFRLFVHVAKDFGWSTRELADALTLTTRRIRQLAGADEPLVELAHTTLADPRLCRVP